MFSHLVTAAKGLFTREEPQDASADSAGDIATTTSNMVSATRRGVIAPEADKPKTNGVAKAGKRKTQSTTEKADDKQSKRRKRDSLEAADASSDDDSTALKGHKMQKSSVGAPKAHFRFDSEEPAVPEATQPVEIPAARQDDDEDEDSDDDAPETVDNSAQLLKIKEQAKKQEKLKQQYVLPVSNRHSLFLIYFAGRNN